MSAEISENEKISKKTEKKLNKLSFSEKEVDILKSLSQKMSKMVQKDIEKGKGLKKGVTDFGSGNQQRMNRARGDFNSDQRGTGANSRLQGGQRNGATNRPGPPRPEGVSPIFEKLIQYIREQGVSRDKIRNVMTTVREIGQEYRLSLIHI